MARRVLAIVSGGMDSVTLAYDLTARGNLLDILSVDYGQRHWRELHCARVAAERLGVRHDVVDLRGLRPLLRGSALTDDEVEVPLGHYAAPSMAATVVPNRNAIMLAVAYGVAVARGISAVAIGVHAGDHPIYPDCRPEFIEAFAAMEHLATSGYAVPGLTLLAPYVELTKADICQLGAELRVPWADTWSCYRGALVHCGRCGTCVERREAFKLAGVVDPTAYEEEA